MLCNLLLLVCISLSDGYQSPRLALHLLKWQWLSEFLQVISGLWVTFIALRLLLHCFFAGPEEAGDVLAGGLDHCISLHHFQLCQELVRQERIEVSEGQMHSRLAFIRVLHGGAQIATHAIVRVVHIADIDLAFDSFSSSLGYRSVICHELRLIDSFRFSVASTEERRYANTITLPRKKSLIDCMSKIYNLKYFQHERTLYYLHIVLSLFRGHTLLSSYIAFNLLPTLQFKPVFIQTWLFKQDASMCLALFALFWHMKLIGAILLTWRSVFSSSFPILKFRITIWGCLFKDHVCSAELL